MEQGVQGDPFAELSRFRGDFYDCLTGRRDALFELADALLCTDGPVKVVALESGRTSWVAPLDAVRLRPGDDLAAVTASQVRDLVERLIAAGQWRLATPRCGS